MMTASTNPHMIERRAVSRFLPRLPATRVFLIEFAVDYDDRDFAGPMLRHAEEWLDRAAVSLRAHGFFIRRESDGSVRAVHTATAIMRARSKDLDLDRAAELELALTQFAEQKGVPVTRLRVQVATETGELRRDYSPSAGSPRRMRVAPKTAREACAGIRPRPVTLLDIIEGLRAGASR